LDRAVTLAVAQRHAQGTAHADDAQLLSRAERAVADYGHLALGDYFSEPCAIEPVVTHNGRADHATVSWPSSHQPLCQKVGADYKCHTPNHQAVVRLFTRERPRPIAILVHGYMGGSFAVEQRIWPMARLDAWGFDVALFTLPFHGVRAATGAVPLFPQSDIGFNLEGFRQSVGDLRDLVHWLRRRGHAQVGVMGMSLGGYVAALTATLEPELDFLIPVVPLACLVDFAREQGRFPRGAANAHVYEKALKRVYRLVSPLSRPSQIAPDRVLVLAGKFDRITPPRHARSLAHHFSAPLEAWGGGHLLQFGRAKSLQRVGTLLRQIANH